MRFSEYPNEAAYVAAPILKLWPLKLFGLRPINSTADLKRKPSNMKLEEHHLFGIMGQLSGLNIVNIQIGPVLDKMASPE